MCWSNLSLIMFRGWFCHFQNLSNSYLVCLSMFVLCCIVQGPKVVKCKDGVAIYGLFPARVSNT